ncbi:hypothetical protein ACROYT_G023699 [Oculina patagonica]
MCFLRFIASVTLSAIILGQISDTNGMLFGSGDIIVPQDKDYECKVFPFNPAFSSDVVGVQLALTSKTYDAAVTWIEGVSKSGFTGCVATSGAITGTRTVSLQWLAYQTVSNGAFERTVSIPMWTTGTKCILENFPQAFSTVPYVFVTPVHRNRNKHDAASVWAEDVKTDNFRACLRELKNFDGAHKYLTVNILAFTNSSVPSEWKIPLADEISFPNNYNPDVGKGYSFCKTVSFPQKFYENPTMITTPKHAKDDNLALIDADNIAITEWIESVSTTEFQVCLKDIQRYDARHDPITLTYMAAGHYHPCNGITCPFYAECNATSATAHECTCKPCTTDESAPLCDNKGKTHKNKCEYNYAACLAKEEPGIQHFGGCKPFVLQRGRVALRLDTEDVRCRTVSFKNGSLFESSRGSVRIQTTINYFNYSGNFIHDAAVTWVEKVSVQSFDVCALKAGRLERSTPDGGLTFIDFIAFQEAPQSSAAGQVLMQNWWDGTQCKSITFESTNITSPHVLVTAEHTVLGLKHDAATVWVENIGASTFSACSREMQNFDGLHENIKLNWFVYDKFPTNFPAEKTLIDFKNDALPRAEDYNSYCKVVNFTTPKTSTPTVIVSASHLNPKLGYTGRLIPEHNSIASWVEQITTTGFQVCIKELHNLNGYDPVKVAALVIGS